MEILTNRTATTGLETRKIATSATPTKLVALATPLDDVRPVEVIIRADSANTAAIFYGYRSNITAGGAAPSGMPLYAGDAVTLPITDVTKIYLVSAAAQVAYADIHA